MSENGPAPKQPPHILVVEDDHATADMLLLLLDLEGYPASWAATSDAALKRLTVPNERDTGHPFPDLVLLDLQIPSMNGAELMQQVKQRNQTPPPVIVLSAWREAAALAAAEQIGALHVLTKPFGVDELMECIADVEVWLAQRRTNKVGGGGTLRRPDSEIVGN